GGEVGKSVAEGFGVAFLELDLLTGPLAACLHGGLPAPEHDDVIADAEEALQNGFADGVAVAEQKDDGDESPDDAEHGEDGTHAIAAEGVDGLIEGFADFHSNKSLRSAYCFNPLDLLTALIRRSAYSFIP